MPPARPRLPLLLKLALTAFVAILVPVYWRDYGPTNFLYYCDVALILSVFAVWLESPLLASAPLVGILVPQTYWIVDFLFTWAGLGHLLGAVGLPNPGMTEYMFDTERPFFTRFLSFFHFWLPFLLLFIVWRLGYDRRAFIAWTLLAWVLMPICYFLLPAPPAPADNKNLPVNVNYVYGLGSEPQAWMDQDLFFALLMVAMPLAIYLPTHLLLCARFRRPEARDASPASHAPQQ